MATYSNFKQDRNTQNRYDIYNNNYENPVDIDESNVIKKSLSKWVECCSWLRWYPDIFYDAITPEKGGITLRLYQRVMMRCLARFPENYFCIPRGGSKTMTEVMEIGRASCRERV